MSCCGQKRTAGQTGLSYHIHNTFQTNTIPPQATEKKIAVCFEYIGRTGLTVMGTISGKRYRFDRTGSLICVDPKDRPSLSAIPQLREIRR